MSTKANPVTPGRPLINCEPVDSQNNKIAHLILGKFFAGTDEGDEEVIEIYHGLPVVVAAAVTVRVVTELDPTEAAEFLALLDEFS